MAEAGLFVVLCGFGFWFLVFFFFCLLPLVNTSHSGDAPAKLWSFLAINSELLQGLKLAARSQIGTCHLEDWELLIITTLSPGIGCRHQLIW